MKKIITKKLIEDMTSYLLNSSLPSNDVQKLCSALAGLPDLVEPNQGAPTETPKLEKDVSPKTE